VIGQLSLVQQHNRSPSLDGDGEVGVIGKVQVDMIFLEFQMLELEQALLARIQLVFQTVHLELRRLKIQQPEFGIPR
jgi:hypothetical protein